MTDDPLTPTEEERLAIGRIAATADGRLLHRHFRRVLEAVWEVDDPGALQRHTGRRTFARDLMRLMAEAIEANSGGRTSSSDTILTRDASAVRVRPHRGAARRVTADTITAGWNDTPDAEPGTGSSSGQAGAA